MSPTPWRLGQSVRVDDVGHGGDVDDSDAGQWADVLVPGPQSVQVLLRRHDRVHVFGLVLGMLVHDRHLASRPAGRGFDGLSGVRQPGIPDDCTEYGGVGVPGSFTLKANGASDVVKYTYQLNDNPVQTKTFTTATTGYTRTFAPDMRGVNTLTVRTWDSAGNGSDSYTYSFKVAAGAGPVDQWSMDDTGSTAADSVGGKDATLTGGAAWTDKARLGKALQGNGTTAYAATTSSALDTTKSFTVSAWVRLTGNSHNAVAVAQSGTNGSAFALYYSTSYQAWIFNRYTSDVASPTIVRSISTATPEVGVWTNVMGVYDAQEQTIQLYVNGVPQGDPVSFTTPWQANGGIQIARGQAGAAFTDYFPARSTRWWPGTGSCPRRRSPISRR